MRAARLLHPLALLVALIVGTDAAGHAGSDPDAAQARKRYQTGTRLYAVGEYAKAVEEFKSAYLLKPDPAFLYNIAQSQRMLGELEAAVGSYKSFLRGKPDTPSRKDVEALIAECDKKLAEKKSAAASAPGKAVEAPARKRERHAPLPFVEPASKHAFPTWTVIDDKEYALLGVGARSVLGFRVYAMAMYVEDEPARAGFPRLAGKAGGADAQTLLKSGLVAPFIVEGDFGKHAVLWFTRAVSARQQRDSYREALGDDVSDKASPEVRRDAEAFLALFDRDMKEGDELVIRTTPDGTIGVSIAGAPMKWGPKNLRIAHEVWDIWLGSKPISADLKSSLLQRVEALGH